MAVLALAAIVRVRPWYTPQYAIPLLGMILGNTLNGVSLGLDRLGSELAVRRDQVEAILALGATRWEAARPLLQQAVKTGLIPTINAMMVVGIVSLPGMMTGQILAGASPVEAVKYQIVIMFLIASATALGTVAVVLLSYRRLFNENHQFEGAPSRSGVPSRHVRSIMHQPQPRHPDQNRQRREWNAHLQVLEETQFGPGTPGIFDNDQVGDGGKQCQVSGERTRHRQCQPRLLFLSYNFHQWLEEQNGGNV